MRFNEFKMYESPIDRLGQFISSLRQPVTPPTTPAKQTQYATAPVVGKPQGANFDSKLSSVAAALGIDKNHILAVMRHESRLDPTAVNPYSGATGLIQFTPKTAASLGTSTQALKKMPAVDQLDYVYKYFKSVGVRPGMTAGDLYVATFMPAHVGKPDHTVVGQRGAPGYSGLVYKQNKGLDLRRTGKITLADLKNSVARFL